MYWIDTYNGIPRLRSRRYGTVVTGLVTRPSMGCRHGIYEVREDGKILKRVSGCSRITLQLAREVAQRTFGSAYNYRKENA